MVGVGLASFVVLGSFVTWEAHSASPDAEARVLPDRRFSMALAAECLGAFGLLGALFVQTQFLQFDLGYSPLQAGLRILPVAALIVRERPVVAGPGPHRRESSPSPPPSAAIAGGLWQISAASTAGHDLQRSRARPAADRPGRRASVADGDELGRGVGPPG